MEKVKHRHKKPHNNTKQRSPTTNCIPSGKTQSAAYTTSFLAPLFIVQLKHLFLHRATQSTGVSVSRSERSQESPAATCAWPSAPRSRVDVAPYGQPQVGTEAKPSSRCCQAKATPHHPALGHRLRPTQGSDGNIPAAKLHRYDKHANIAVEILLEEVTPW